MPDRRTFLKTGGLALAAGYCAAGTPSFTSAAEVQPAPPEDAPSPITPEEFEERRERARELMGENDIGAVMLTGGTSMRYFTGVGWGRSERLFACILPREGEPVWISPTFEGARAAERTGGGADIRTWEEDESPFKLIAGFLKEKKLDKMPLGIEETVRYFAYEGVKEASRRIEIVSADPVTHGCRGVKSSHEIELMRYVNGITLDTIRSAFAKMEEGMTQRELSGIVSAGYAERGFRGWALVLFGANAAFPHGTANRETISPGKIVLVDTGTNIHGYQSDISRTTVFGEPSKRQMEAWNAVKEAQTAALRKAKPGVKTGDVDRAAREVVTRAGFGKDYEHFTHRLGHGIGMDGHEYPYLVRGNSLKLQPGMSFSNEPGIYLRGEFGVRLEDIMYITESGAELMTQQASSITEA